MSRFWNTASPPLAENRECILERLAEVQRGVSAPATVRSTSTTTISPARKNPRAGRPTTFGDQPGGRHAAATEYHRQGFAWAILSGDAMQLSESRANHDSIALANHEALGREGTLVAEFKPESWRRMGPVIRIYRLDSLRTGQGGAGAR